MSTILGVVGFIAVIGSFVMALNGERNWFRPMLLGLAMLLLSYIAASAYF